MEEQKYAHILAFLTSGEMPDNAEVSTASNFRATAAKFDVNASGSLTRNGLVVVKKNMQGEKFFFNFFSFFLFLIMEIFYQFCFIYKFSPTIRSFP